MGVSSLPKTVTRQRCDCDLNPGPSGPESSTLTTRLPSHPTTTNAELFNRLERVLRRLLGCQRRRPSDGRIGAITETARRSLLSFLQRSTLGCVTQDRRIECHGRFACRGMHASPHGRVSDITPPLPHPVVACTATIFIIYRETRTVVGPTYKCTCKQTHRPMPKQMMTHN